jgi:peptide/nickel transport system substrate-binding protein
MTIGNRAFCLIAATVVLTSACAGQRTQTTSEPSAAGQSSAKVLVVGENREPAVLFALTGGKGETGIGIIGSLAHDKLTQTDPFGLEHPGLAVQVPSADNGTWVINSDGSMDLTWKLKPDIKWHDGTPFTADDMMFTLALNKDPDLISDNPTVAKAMERATSPDPHTFIVHWSRTDVLATSPRALTPLPKHLLEGLYRDDKDSLGNSPLFREQFVGLGPYKLTEWVQGSHIETVRFDDYHMGRPPLDRVVVRYVLDQNALVANIMAGALDMVVPKSVETDASLELRRQWQGTGNTVRIEAIPRIIYLEMMMRPEYARPANGLPNTTVRQALYHAIDRQGIADAATGGLGLAADSWYDPKDPIRGELESSIVKYPYDPARAQQLVAQAGWTRGSDGVLLGGNGERFETEVWVNPQAAGPAGAVVVDNWKAVGVDAGLHNVPLARAQDRGYLSQRPGALATDAGSAGTGLTDRYDSRDLATAANNWAGRNRAGYMNSRADELYDLLNVTIDPDRRKPLLQEQVRIFTAEVVTMPLYWMVSSTLMTKGVKADVHPNAAGYRTYLWDRD